MFALPWIDNSVNEFLDPISQLTGVSQLGEKLVKNPRELGHPNICKLSSSSCSLAQDFSQEVGNVEHLPREQSNKGFNLTHSLISFRRGFNSMHVEGTVLDATIRKKE